MAYTEKNTANGLNIPSSHCLTPLWFRLQTAFKETTRELFIEERPGKIQIALDDGKEHYSNAPGKSTNGLKYTQHVHDNKNGFIQYTATSSFLNGENILLGLRNVEVNADKAYWTMALVYGFLLPAGAANHGTLKRALNWPFTFEQ
eukprot:8106291-Ditylum_brightwellii.AAC.1